MSSKNSTELWGDILCQKKMRKNLYQASVQAAIPYKGKNIQKNIGKTTSTKKQRRTISISTKKSANNHDKKHGKNQEWWNLEKNAAYFVGISSLLILAIFWLKQFDFCSRRFLLKLFLVAKKHVPWISLLLHVFVFSFFESRFFNLQACLFIYFSQVSTYQHFVVQNKSKYTFNFCLFQEQ